MSAVESKSEIVSRLRAAADHLRSRGVVSLALFGSWARDAGQSASDVDLLVEFRPHEKTFARYLELAEFFEKLLDRHVDLVTTDGLSPHIGPKIRAEALDVVRAA